MNKDEIKKAFDICFSAQKSCNGCPLLVLEKQNGRGCKYNLFTSVFDIITEQEKEIERLKAENEQLEENIDMLIKEQKGDYDFEIKQAKIDVLNELKNRLVVYYPSVISVIDELIKELIK